MLSQSPTECCELSHSCYSTILHAVLWLCGAPGMGCVNGTHSSLLGCREGMHIHAVSCCVSLVLKDACVWPQERHWKRAAACAVAHEAAAASRRSMLKHTSAIDAELQSCQDKVTA